MIFVLAAIVFVQFALNWALLNRLLLAKGIEPIKMPDMKTETEEAKVEPRRKLFSMRVD